MGRLGGWRRRLSAIGLGLGALLFIRQAWLSYQAVRQQEFIHLRPICLVGGLVLSLFLHALQMLAWTMIMRYLGVFIGLRQVVRGYFLSFLPRYIPGSVWGYWSRSRWLEQSFGVGYTTSLLGSVLEASVLVLTALSIAGLYVCTCSVGFVRLVLALGSVGMLGLTWLIAPRVAVQISQRLGKGETSVHCRRGGSLRAWSAAIALCLLLWVTYGGSVLLIGNAIRPIPFNDMPGVTFASSLSWAVGFITVVLPAGIGIRELALSALLPLHSHFVPWQANLTAVTSRLEIISAELGWLTVGLGLYAHKRWSGLIRRELFPRHGEE